MDLPTKIVRFSLQQRVQHATMAVSVLMLIITGFPIKYAAQDWAQYVVNLFGGFENMFHTHLVFGVIMILSALYHVIWLAYTFPCCLYRSRLIVAKKGSGLKRAGALFSCFTCSVHRRPI